MYINHTHMNIPNRNKPHESLILFFIGGGTGPGLTQNSLLFYSLYYLELSLEILAHRSVHIRDTSNNVHMNR